jgi:hypothetical protein
MNLPELPIEAETMSSHDWLQFAKSCYDKGRADALEEAAKVCDSFSHSLASRAATAIRVLKDSK